MKRRTKWGSPTIWLLVALVVLVSCSKPKPLVFKGINQFKIDDIGMDSSSLFAELAFSNPNDMKLDLKKIDCDIFANDHLVGHYLLDSLMEIPANADFNYPARIRIDMHPIVQNAISAFLTGSVDLHIVGVVKVGRAGVYVNVPIDFAHQQKLSF